MRRKTLIVRFKGGLGNQMFQYAFYKKLESLNPAREVLADLTWYDNQDVKFVLSNVFPGVALKCDEKGKMRKEYEQKHKNRNFFVKVIHKIFPLCRFKLAEKEDGVFQEEILNYRRGVLEGYWQTTKYWETIDENIITDFSFTKANDQKLKDFLELIQRDDTVSVHIRRGDYLLPENQALFGDICTLEYYERAIAYMHSQIENVKFVFFTNDVEWVKEHFDIKDAIFATDYMEGETPDWCDMYMMSQCKHHIIANSTFSWWGAYLGKNASKIVIAPAKWLNGKSTKDIWQEKWIKL